MIIQLVTPTIRKTTRQQLPPSTIRSKQSAPHVPHKLVSTTSDNGTGRRRANQHVRPLETASTRPRALIVAVNPTFRRVGSGVPGSPNLNKQDASLHQRNRYGHHSDGNDVVDLTDHRTHRSSQTAEHALATTISTSHALVITNGSSNALANTFSTSNALANTCSASNALAITNGTSNTLANTFGTSHVLAKPSNHRLGTSTATHMDADIKLCLRPRAPRCTPGTNAPNSENAPADAVSCSGSISLAIDFRARNIEQEADDRIASYGRITATSTQPSSHQPWQLAASPGSARPSVSQQPGPEPLRTRGFGTSLRFVNDQGLNHFADACQQNHQHRVRHVPPSRNKQGLNHFAHAGSACPSASSTTRA
ncbi:hypothetical protein GEV33_014754 [Tenebrio molitor]|uniref:Uncharacterized protein n=1 Tax=Tenebrio molitor TaxID=7067 RepID=A0A8J6H674_TENMO|nr:hypothetical protein GEV33_014755 [Tenebrio molitor]KAH0808037.1 hypothetical protein GEV33_014754 [Tenebrio molitor]